MADALPILKQAGQVRVLMVVNDKPEAIPNQGAEALRHLGMHGITAHLDEVDAAGEPIGTVFDRYLADLAPDLLVMGAYGHSRAREFLLGGATEHTLKDPVCPVFLSH